MALQTFTLRTQAQHANQRLDQVLAEWLPQAVGKPLSKSKIRKLVVAGAVYLNGRRIRIASKPIIPNAKIDVHVDLARLEATDQSSNDRAFELKSDAILFEDEWLIALNKPPGLPTQPTLDEARNNLFGSLRKFMQTREKNPAAYVGLHHRLDRDTSGVVLFTKKKDVNAAVADLFAKHLAQKIYRAIAIRPAASDFKPGVTWTVKNYLARAKGSGKKSRFESVRSGGDSAWTDFKLIESIGDVWHVEAAPRTGRTHQIRVHLSEEGAPILGDATYGEPSKLYRALSEKASRLMLHAHQLKFKHPVTGEDLVIESPLPEDFKQCLRAFGGKTF